jgi:hypothetical protein
MERTIKRAMCIFMFIVLAAAPVIAQANTLAVSENTTVVDGVINAEEYSFQQDFGQMKIYLNLTADTLWIGAIGNTKGWVAVGLGSTKMGGATIFMGFLEEGKVQFKPQMGLLGHRHQDVTDKQVSDSIISSAMKQDGGKTTLEVALKAATYIQNQSKLDMIFAIGPVPSFMVVHTFRGSLSVKLAS